MENPQVEKKRSIKSVKRDNHNRPENWQKAPSWKDTENYYHPVDATELDSYPIHGSIPKWVLERRGEATTANEPQFDQGAVIDFGFHTTDTGNAERLIQRFGSILRYCYEKKRWLVWTRKQWHWDSGNRTEFLAKATARGIYAEAAGATDETRRKELGNYALTSENDHRIAAMMRLAQSELGIPITINELDTDPYLFNCNNGTLNL